MDRKDFLKKTCLYGICSCAGLSLISNSDAFASTKAEEDEDWRIGFVQARFSKLIDILDSTVDSGTKNKILENLGRTCSSQSAANYNKFVGNIEGFLSDMKQNWAQEAIYDKNRNEIRIKGKKTDSCFCPFVDMKKMSKDFCDCTLGWQKQTFETILGKKVTARIDASVIRGGESCDFTISVI
jgi:hypothetical protein